ncbi:hypothetical protein BCD48_40590 [Pseudofrankia sp. BMG5.36]|nr:hypothetical protein BCD48_40590 [Pseudofrankia sp. BMG5.36]
MATNCRATSTGSRLGGAWPDIWRSATTGGLPSGGVIAGYELNAASAKFSSFRASGASGSS